MFTRFNRDGRRSATSSAATLKPVAKPKKQYRVAYEDQLNSEQLEVVNTPLEYYDTNKRQAYIIDLMPRSGRT